MSKKQWEIKEMVTNDFTLSRYDVSIHFDDIGDDGVCWEVFKGEHLVARLLMRTNEIINYEDWAERIAL